MLLTIVYWKLFILFTERSPVFRKMFQGNNLESAKNKVTIDDGYSTVSAMINWMYNGCTGDIDLQGAIDLYKLSDRYELHSLTRTCGKLIYAGIRVETALEIYLLGKVYQDKALVDKAVSVIIK